MLTDKANKVSAVTKDQKGDLGGGPHLHRTLDEPLFWVNGPSINSFFFTMKMCSHTIKGKYQTDTIYLYITGKLFPNSLNFVLIFGPLHFPKEDNFDVVINQWCHGPIQRRIYRRVGEMTRMLAEGKYGFLKSEGQQIKTRTKERQYESFEISWDTIASHFCFMYT